MLLYHPDSDGDLIACFQNGYSALHIASSKGYDVIVRELLARGGAPNLSDKDGRTALHLAAAAGHTEVVRDLLRRGADPDRKDKVMTMIMMMMGVVVCRQRCLTVN